MKETNIITLFPEKFLREARFFLEVNDEVPPTMANTLQQNQKVAASGNRLIKNLVFEELGLRKVIGYKYLFENKNPSVDDFIEFYNALPKNSRERKLHQWYEILIPDDVDFVEEDLKFIKELLPDKNQITRLSNSYSLYSSHEPYRPYQHFFNKINIQSIWDRIDPEHLNDPPDNQDGHNSNSNPLPDNHELIAVIDTGIDFDHKELKHQYFPVPKKWPKECRTRGYNSWDKTFDDYNDRAGHGTFIAGLASALVNNEEGRGVIPNFKVINIKAFPNGRTQALAEAIYFAVKQGATIINCSWGSKFHSIDLDKMLYLAFEFAFLENNVVFVCAAGNQGNDVHSYFPANYCGAITVGASNINDSLLESSNHGLGIDILAPGESILGLSIKRNREGITKSGTSFANSIVTGCLAAVLSLYPIIREKYKQNPKKLVSELKILMELAAVPVDSMRPLGPKKGRIDAYLLLEAAEKLKCRLSTQKGPV